MLLSWPRRFLFMYKNTISSERWEIEPKNLRAISRYVSLSKHPIKRETYSSYRSISSTLIPDPARCSIISRKYFTCVQLPFTQISKIWFIQCRLRSIDGGLEATMFHSKLIAWFRISGTQAYRGIDVLSIDIIPLDTISLAKSSLSYDILHINLKIPSANSSS